MGTLSHSWWTDTFAGVIASLGRTVLVLQPWHAPVPLGRSWCLWEIFSTVQGGSALDIALTRAEEARFKQAMVRTSERACLSAWHSRRIHPSAERARVIRPLTPHAAAPDAGGAYG